MGILDLFTMIGGGAWLTKEAIRETADRGEEKFRDGWIKRYVENHTDIELEQKMLHIINTSSAEMWARLETFKRDNPVWCKAHENKPEYDAYFKKYRKAVSGWQDVGVTRKIPFADYDGPVLKMLMETYGKLPVRVAQYQAEKAYPEIQSRRKW